MSFFLKQHNKILEGMHINSIFYWFGAGLAKAYWTWSSAEPQNNTELAVLPNYPTKPKVESHTACHFYVILTNDQQQECQQNILKKDTTRIVPILLDMDWTIPGNFFITWYWQMSILTIANIKLYVRNSYLDKYPACIF